MLVGKKGAPVHSIFNLSQLHKFMKMSYKWARGIDLYLAKQKQNIKCARNSVQLCIAFLPFTESY